MSEKKRGLGRGLSALIGDSAAQADTAHRNDRSNDGPKDGPNGGGPLRYLGIDRLRPGVFQPRKNFAADELAALAVSLEKSGVLQPLLVRPIAGETGQFEIIAGERRWRAAQMAGLHQVPVIVQKINDVTALEIGIIENVQRTDLNPIEEAEGYQRLIDEFAYTQAELAETIGKSRSHIANLLRLIGAAPAVRTALIDGSLSMGHARALLGVNWSTSQIEKIIAKIIADGLSVRAVEKLAAENKTRSPRTPASKRGAPDKNADTRALEKTIGDAIGLKVSIDDKGNNKGGALRVDYKSLEQLDDLVTRLMGRQNL